MYEFRYAVMENLDEIMELYRCAIGEEGCTWDENYPNMELAKRDILTKSLLCLTENNIIIAAIAYDEDDEVERLEGWSKRLGRARELARLVVKKEYRNMGLARLMILKAMSELKERGYKAVHYLVSECNERAVRSYAKLNFACVRQCSCHGRQWLMYEKSLYHMEKKITGEYKKNIWKPFVEGVEKYNLIKDGDKIAVCISGGKDSMLLAKLLQMVKNNRMYDIELVFIMINPGYSGEQLEKVSKNALAFGIELKIFETDIFKDMDEIGRNPCFFCSRMRRGYLYRKAKELGCNKIALGHHYDDVIETILMGMLYGAQIQTMLPILKSDNVDNMELIRPMYLIKEESINSWRDNNGYDFVKCACNLNVKDGSEDTTRLKVRKLIEDLKHDNEAVPANIFGSVMNVDLNKILSYKKDGKIYFSYK